MAGVVDLFINWNPRPKALKFSQLIANQLYSLSNSETFNLSVIVLICIVLLFIKLLQVN